MRSRPMSADNTTMDFYTLNFPFTLNLLLEPSNFPSVWCEREDEGKSASLKSCPRHQTVKSSDAQSQKKKRKMNLFFFFWPRWPNRHGGIQMSGYSRTLHQLSLWHRTRKQIPGVSFRAGLTQTDVDFDEVGPSDYEHGSYTLQPVPLLIYQINTGAT